MSSLLRPPVLAAATPSVRGASRVAFFDPAKARSDAGAFVPGLTVTRSPLLSSLHAEWLSLWRNFIFAKGRDGAFLKLDDISVDLQGLFDSRAKARSQSGEWRAPLEVAAHLRSSYGTSSTRLNSILDCAEMEVDVAVDGRVEKKALPHSARGEFLGFARVFLAFERLPETSLVHLEYAGSCYCPSDVVGSTGNGTEYLDLHFIREISRAVITAYWQLPEGERDAVFEKMPSLIDSPGYLFHEAHTGLASEVARVLYLSLYNSMFGHDKWPCPCRREHKSFGLKFPPNIFKGAIKPQQDSGNVASIPEIIKQVAPDGKRVCDVRVLIVSDDTVRQLERVGYADFLKMLRDTGFFVRESTGQLDLVECAERVRKDIDSLEIDVVVAFGGGTAVDVAKLASAGLDVKREIRDVPVEPKVKTMQKRCVPFISVPTALTQDGAASSTASLRLLYKKSFSARAPAAVVIDLGIVQQAPLAFTASGLGDCVKFTELADALLARARGAFGDSANWFSGAECCLFMSALLAETSFDLLRNSTRLRSSDESAFVNLAKYLIASAYTTGATGDSGMISRSAHGASHALDIALGNPNVGKRTHGSQVALFSIVSARIYEELFGIPPFGISWRVLKDHYDSLGLPVSSKGMSVPGNLVIEAYLRGAASKPSRYTLLHELFRIFEIPVTWTLENEEEVSLDLAQQAKAGALASAQGLDSDASTRAEQLTSKYGLGMEGLRSFITAMMMETEVVVWS
ncbi:iron-containing alcohol dehydrogenase [Candidatus Micrarchaeota archaeon]|nr:iron-containing alcohol dehydrogenase [Candidatus Micrarchaeota archaeon]